MLQLLRTLAFAGDLPGERRLEAEEHPLRVQAVDLLGKAHLGVDYLRINPQGLLPPLSMDRGPSSSIRWRSSNTSMISRPRLRSIQTMPTRARDLRAWPCGLLRTLIAHRPSGQRLSPLDLGAELPALRKWIETFGQAALQTIETYLETDPHAARFCYGNTPTVADIFVASHVVGMQLLGFDLARFPKIAAVFDACTELEAFKTSHPLAQPGADAAILRP